MGGVHRERKIDDARQRDILGTPSLGEGERNVRAGEEVVFLRWSLE